MISVCMATFNGEKYVVEQIESILKQLDVEDELIISDDGSTDNTINLIKLINDKRIKLYFKNGYSYTENFENALKKAKGDYIFLSDQDDVWSPNKVQVCLNYLKEYDFVMSDATVVDENLKVINSSRNSYHFVKNGFLRNFIKTYYLGCCMAFKRNVLDFVLPFPTNSKLCLHDAWISLNAELFFKTKVIDEQLILYRRHSNNTSNGSIVKKLNIRKYFMIRIYLFFNLINNKLRRNIYE